MPEVADGFIRSLSTDMKWSTVGDDVQSRTYTQTHTRTYAHTHVQEEE